MREIRQSGSEGGGTKPIASPYPYQIFCRSAARYLRWSEYTQGQVKSLASHLLLQLARVRSVRKGSAPQSGERSVAHGVSHG